MPKLIDFKGQRVGKLVLGDRAGFNSSGKIRWSFVCDCGATGAVLAADLRRGDTVSCGCHRRAVLASAAKTHGHANPASRTYRAWASMRDRARNLNLPTAAHYSLRGIRACERWDSFQSFLEDMGECPEGLTLERCDVNGHYEPGNCKWVTQQEQVLNQRRSWRFLVEGEWVSSAAYADRQGILRRSALRKARKEGVTTLRNGDLTPEPNQNLERYDMQRDFILENIDAAIAAVQAQPEELFDLACYRMVEPCGTLFCTAGLLTQTPHFIRLGWSLLTQGGGATPLIENQSLDFLVNDHMGPDAFYRLFAPAGQGLWDEEIEENADQAARITDKYLALQRLAMQRTYVMEMP